MKTTHALALVTLCLAACGTTETPDPAVADAGFFDASEATTDAGADPIDAGPAPTAACTKDPAAIQRARICGKDEHCPCGAYCDRGVCAADCMDDDACGAGMRCDLFGRCRADTDTRRIALFATTPRGRIFIAEPLITVPGPMAPRVITIGATGGAVTGARVRAGANLEIALGVAGTDAEMLTYEKSIVLPELADGAVIAAYVRAAPGTCGPTDPLVSDVVVTDGDNERTSVTVADEAGLAGRLAYASVPATTPPVEGVYTGFATLGGTGIGGALGAVVTPGQVSKPIRATVYTPRGGRATIVIEDPFRVVVPRGRWIGEMVLDETPRIEMPSFELLAPLSVGGAPSHVVVAAVTAELSTDPTAQDFDGELSMTPRLVFDGIAGLGARPFADWTFALSRDGDLPEGAVAPELDVPTTLAYDVDDARAALFAQEAFVRAALRGTTTVDALEMDRRSARTANAPVGRCTDELVDEQSDMADDARAIIWGTSWALVARGDRFSSVFPVTCRSPGTCQRTFGEIRAGSLSPLATELARRMSGIADDVVFDEFAAILPVDAPTAYITATERLPGALPCAYDLSLNGVVSDGNLDADLTGTSTSVCARMSRVYDCEVQAVPATADNRHSLAILTRSDVASARISSIIDAQVTQVCVFSALPPGCGESHLCDDAGATTASGLIGPEHARSGDLSCDNGMPGATLPFDDAPMAADALLAACEADIDAVFATPSTPGDNSVAASGWPNSTACLSPQRFLPILGAATDRARGGSRGADLDTALAARLLERWLRLHGFIASEAKEQAPLIGEMEQVEPLSRLEARLQASLRGWRLFLTPRIGAAVNRLDGAALFEPDYRRLVLTGDPTTLPHQTQAQGLLTAMAETLAVQAELTQEITERHALRGVRELPASVRESIRYQILIHAILAGLLDRGINFGLGTPPRWRDTANAALARLESSRAELLLAAEVMVAGANPLGIEDVDLPLYFREIRTDAGSRFFALTDYLLGASGDRRAIVPMTVDEAQAAFTAARTSYLTERQRMVNADNNANQLALRIGNAIEGAGEDLQDLCGAEAFTDANGQPLPAADILASLDDDADLSRCWFRSERPECNVVRAVTTPNVADPDPLIQLERAPNYNLCVASQLYVETGYAAVHQGFPWGSNAPYVMYYVPGYVYASSTLSEFVNDIVTGPGTTNLPDAWQGGPTQTVPARHGVSGGGCIEYNGRCLGPEFRTIFLDLPADSNPCVNDDFPDFPGLLPELITDDSVDPPTFTLRCRPAAPLTGPVIEHPWAPTELAQLLVNPSPQQVSSAVRLCRRLLDPTDAPALIRQVESRPRECYTGAIGAQALAINGISTNVDIIRQEGLDKLDEYELNMDSCLELRAGNASLQSTLQAHNAAVFAKLDAKLAWDIAAIFANNTADCLDGISGSGEEKWQYGLAAAGCAARALEGTFSSIAVSLERDIDKLDRAHELTMLQIEGVTEERRCEIEAELALVGVQTNGLQLIQALEEMLSAYRDLEVAQKEINLTLSRGRSGVADAEDSGVRVPGADPWLSRDMLDYRRKMKLAKRATYIALRAVEYELQLSLRERGTVLQATLPSELDAVLDTLRQLTATQNVNGARPAELTEVFSLREHLLQVADRSDTMAMTEHNLTAEERFRAFLLDPRFEEYDNGQLVGRRIPFDLAPLGTFDRGVVRGIPLVSDNSCAERLWSINVTIQGDAGRLVQGVSPQVNLEVRKKNAFYANWCQPDQQGRPFQQASVRPSRNLFREPGAGGFDPMRGADETDAFAKGRVQAMLNIPPQQFVSDMFEEGATTELAARLLFGGYELFIPATSLAPRDAAGAPAGDGLVIEAIDDILLRFDYLSVAR